MPDQYNIAIRNSNERSEYFMANPKCPDCGESGIDKITSTPSEERSRENTPWFYVSHCDNCGHVYGIFTKHVFGRSGPQLVIEGKK